MRVLSRRCLDCENEFPVKPIGRVPERCQKCSAERTQALSVRKLSDYQKTDAYRESQRKYAASPKHRLRLARYYRSEKGRASRRKALLKPYSLTPKQFDEMSAEQFGVCAICREKPSGLRGSAILSVDHDHETGIVRGLLCGPCNRALAILESSRFPAMMVYLETHRGRERRFGNG